MCGNSLALIPIAAIVISIIAFNFKRNVRINDIRPLFEYSDIYPRYHDIKSKNRISYIELTIINRGGKAFICRIEDKTANIIYTEQLNKYINTNEFMSLTINPNKTIKHEDINYDIDLFIKDIENREYLQTIKGPGIYPKISQPNLRKKSLFKVSK